MVRVCTGSRLTGRTGMPARVDLSPGGRKNRGDVSPALVMAAFLGCCSRKVIPVRMGET